MSVKVRERPTGSGIWWVFIDHGNKRKAKKIGCDKRLALEVAKKIEAKLTLGDLGLVNGEYEPALFEDYADRWISIVVPATCKELTLEGYQRLLKTHIMTTFGKMPITEVNRAIIKEFLMGKFKAGCAASSVNHMKSALSGILTLAVDDGTIAINPAQRLGKLFRSKPVGEELNPLTRDELGTLLEAFKLHAPVHYPLALTLARTGMRIGEAFGLQWGDVDFNGRFLTVRRGVSHGRVINSTKTNRTRRVDMSLQLCDTLLKLKRQRAEETLKNGWRGVPPWVFCSETGGPLFDRNWRERVFFKMLAKAGLRQIRVHDLRHTFATLLIEAGESLAYVRDQLGHTSIKTTVDIYGHLTPGGNREAVDRLDDDATIRNLSATEGAR